MTRPTVLLITAGFLAIVAGIRVVNYKPLEVDELPTTTQMAAASQNMGPAGPLQKAEPDGSLTLLSPVYRLDRIYRSMEGPNAPHPQLRFGYPPNAPLWITGIETEIVDPQTLNRVSQEFFCHANLTFDKRAGTPESHNAKILNGRGHLDWRLFTLVPGRLSIRFPKGFGIMIPGDALLDYYSMSLNLNVADRIVDVRLKTHIETVSSQDANAPTKALFRRAFYVMQPQPAKGEIPTPAKATHAGFGCADMCSVNASAVAAVGKAGEGMTVHWMVPPGAHTYRSDLDSQWNIPFDTRIHYATIHLHPFAKSLTLRDKTTDEVILSLKSKDWADRIGVESVEEMSSETGVPILKDHQYELIAEYQNTTGEAVDAMAILYLYLLEQPDSSLSGTRIHIPYSEGSANGTHRQG